MSYTPEKGVARSGEMRDRPFDPKVISQAQGLAACYRVQTHRESDGYIGTVSEFPAVRGFGTSEHDAVVSTRELLKWAIAYLIETGRTPTPTA